MSWAADEWKDGLPPLALQKIIQLEIQVTNLEKDRDKEQCRLDSIEVAFQNQKKRTEDEKTANAQLSRDMKVMADSHEDMQKKVDKMQHDLSVKDGTILNLEGTVALNKVAIEGEHEKVLLGKKLEASLQECEQLSIELQKLKDTVKQRLERNEHLMTVVMDRDVSLEKAHADKKKLTIQIAGQEKELYVLKSEMDTLKTNFVAMTSSLDRTKLHMHEEMEKISNEHSNHIIQLNEQLTLASELNNKLQNDLTEAERHEKDLVEIPCKYETSQHTIVEEQVSNSAMHQQVAVLQEQLAVVEADLQQSKTSHDHLESTSLSKQSMVDKLMMDVKNALSDVEHLNEQLTCKEKHKCELLLRINILELSECGMQNSVAENKSLLVESVGKVINLQKLLATQVEELNVFKQHITEKDKEISMLIDHISSLKTEITDIRSGLHLENEKLITGFETLSKDNEQLLLKFNGTEKQLQNSRSEYEGLLQQLRMQVLSKEEERASLFSDNKSLNTELEINKEKLSIVSQEVTQLKHGLDLSQQALLAMREKFNALSDDCLQKENNVQKLFAEKNDMTVKIDVFQNDYKCLLHNSQRQKESLALSEETLAKQDMTICDLKSTLCQKIAEIDKLSNEYEIISKSLSDYVEKASEIDAGFTPKKMDMENEMITMRQERDDLLANVEHMHSALRSKICECEKVQCKLENESQYIIALKESLCSTESANAKYQDKLEKLNLQFDQIITDKKNHINENCDLRRECSKYLDEQASIKEKLQQAEIALQQEMQNCLKQTIMYEETVDTLSKADKSHKEEMQSVLDKHRAEKMNMTCEIEQFERVKRQVENEKEELQVLFGNLQVNFSVIISEKECLQSELVSKSEQYYAKMQAMVEKQLVQRSSLEEFQTLNDIAMQDLQMRDTKIVSLLSQIDLLQSELNSHMSKLEQIEIVLTCKQNEYAECKIKEEKVLEIIASLEGHLDKVTSDRNEKQLEVTVLASQNSTIAAEIKHAELTVVQTMDELELCKNLNTEHVHKVQELSSTLASQSMELRDAHFQLAVQGKQIKDQDSEFKDFQYEVKQLLKIDVEGSEHTDVIISLSHVIDDRMQLMKQVSQLDLKLKEVNPVNVSNEMMYELAIEKERGEIVNHKEDLRNLRNSVSNLIDTSNNKGREIECANTQMKTLQQEVALSLSKNDDLVNNMDGLSSNQMENETKVHRLEVCLDEVNKQCENMVSMLSNAENVIRLKTDTITSLQDKLWQLRHTGDEGCSKLHFVELEHGGLHLDIECLIQQLVNLHSELSVKNVDFENSVSDNERLNKIMSTCYKHLESNNNEEMAYLESNVEHHQGACLAIETQKSNMKCDISELETVKDCVHKQFECHIQVACQASGEVCSLLMAICSSKNAEFQPLHSENALLMNKDTDLHKQVEAEMNDAMTEQHQAAHSSSDIYTNNMRYVFGTVKGVDEQVQQTILTPSCFPVKQSNTFSDKGYNVKSKLVIFSGFEICQDNNEDKISKKNCYLFENCIHKMYEVSEVVVVDVQKQIMSNQSALGFSQMINNFGEINDTVNMVNIDMLQMSVEQIRIGERFKINEFVYENIKKFLQSIVICFLKNTRMMNILEERCTQQQLCNNEIGELGKVMDNMTKEYNISNVSMLSNVNQTIVSFQEKLLHLWSACIDLCSSLKCDVHKPYLDCMLFLGNNFISTFLFQMFDDMKRELSARIAKLYLTLESKEEDICSCNAKIIEQEAAYVALDKRFNCLQSDLVLSQAGEERVHETLLHMTCLLETACREKEQQQARLDDLLCGQSAFASERFHTELTLSGFKKKLEMCRDNITKQEATMQELTVTLATRNHAFDVANSRFAEIENSLKNICIGQETYEKLDTNELNNIDFDCFVALKHIIADRKHLEKQLTLLLGNDTQRHLLLYSDMKYQLVVEKEKSDVMALAKGLFTLQNLVSGSSFEIEEKEFSLECLKLDLKAVQTGIVSLTEHSKVRGIDFEHLSSCEIQPGAKVYSQKIFIDAQTRAQKEFVTKCDKEMKSVIGTMSDVEASLKKEIAFLQRTCDTLQHSLSSVESEHDRLFQEADESSNLVESLHTKFDEACSSNRSDAEHLTKEKEMLMQKIVELSEQLQSKKKIDDDYKAKLQQQLADYATFRVQLQNVQSDFIELKSAEEKAVQRISSLEFHIESNAAEMETLRTNYSELFSQHSNLCVEKYNIESQLVQLTGELELSQKNLEQQCVKVNNIDCCMTSQNLELEVADQNLAQMKDQIETIQTEDKIFQVELLKLLSIKQQEMSNVNIVAKLKNIIAEKGHLEEHILLLEDSILQNEHVLQSKVEEHNLAMEIENAKCCDLVDEIADLRCMISTTLFEVEEAKQELECTEHSLMEANQELASITSENKVLTDDWQQLSASKGQMEAKVSKLEKCVEKLRGQNENVAARLCEAESVVCSLDEVVASLQQECDTLHSSLAEVESVRMQLNNDVDTADGCIERLRTEMADNCSAKSAEVDALIDEKRIMNERLVEIAKQHESAEEELHCCKAQLLEQQASTTAMHSTLRIQLNDMQTELSSTKEALLAGENTAAALDRKYRLSEGKLDAMKALQVQLENVIEDNKKLETDRFSLKGILSSLEAEKNKSMVLLNDAIDTAEQSKKQHLSTENQLSNAFMEKQQLQHQIEKQTERIHNLLNDYRLLVEREKCLCEKIENMDIKLKVLEDEKGNVQNQLDNVKAEFYDVSNRLSEFEVAKTKHVIQSSILNAKLEDVDALKKQSSFDVNEDMENVSHDKDTIEELRSALMRSQEDTDYYLKEYNCVLHKVLSFKKAKENAELALDRYKYFSDMRRRHTMQGVEKQTGHLTEVVTQSAETQSICVVPATVVSPPSTMDDRVLNSNTSVSHSSTKSSESGCSLLTIRHKTSNTMECCVIPESSPPCCLSLSASDGHVNITVSTAISAQPSLTTEKTCLSNNSCQSDKAMLADGCSTELIGQIPKTDKGFGQGCDQDVDVTINGSHLGMMTRNRFCQTKRKLCQDALAHTTVCSQRTFTNPDGARSKNPAVKSVLGINKPTAALNIIASSPKRRGVIKGLNRIVGLPGVYPDPVQLTGKTKSTTDRDRFVRKNCQANDNVNECKQS